MSSSGPDYSVNTLKGVVVVGSDTVVRALRIFAILLLLYAVTRFWHQYYHWSGAYDPVSGTSPGSTYFHWDDLSTDLSDALDENLGWVRASLLALVLYVLIRARSYWRGWAIGIPGAIVLAGLAMGLGIYFGLTAVGYEIEAGLRSVASDIGDVASQIGSFGPIDVNLNH